MQKIYILIAIIVLAIVAILAFYRWKSTRRPERISRLASLAFIFIMGGLIFGDNRLIGYLFLGLGVIFGVIDIIQKAKKKGRNVGEVNE